MKHIHALAREIERAIRNAEGRVADRFVKIAWDVARRFGFRHDEAREIVHETLSVVLITIHNQEFRGQAAVTSFTYQVGKNLCIKRLKHRNRLKRGGGKAIHQSLDRVLANMLAADPRHSNPLEILKQREHEALTRASIAALTKPDYRGVLSLLLDGYTREEICVALNLPLKRVNAIISYGPKLLTRAARHTTRKQICRRSILETA